MVKYVIMGVSGCGKTAIGAEFAAAIGARFIDGDDLHPATNVAKMAAGHPLDDADRAPWLADVGRTLATTEGGVVIGCSALKRSYRDVIRAAAGQAVTFLHLKGDMSVIAARLAARKGHFMPPSLLESQFATLEPLGADELAVIVDIDQAPQAIVAELVKQTSKDRT
jgi:gluconokinase